MDGFARSGSSFVIPPGGGNQFVVEGAVEGGRALFRLAGDLDFASVGRLDAATADAKARGARTLVLDLSQLDFIDSTGLHALAKAAERQRAVGGQVILRSPTPQTMRVLEIVGLSTVLTITE